MGNNIGQCDGTAVSSAGSRITDSRHGTSLENSRFLSIVDVYAVSRILKTKEKAQYRRP